jgi:hypothetical protein
MRYGVEVNTTSAVRKCYQTVRVGCHWMIGKNDSSSRGCT